MPPDVSDDPVPPQAAVSVIAATVAARAMARVDERARAEKRMREPLVEWRVNRMCSAAPMQHSGDRWMACRPEVSGR
ncbi:30S ribosomal protein S2 [Gordonia aichiensis NBRC 108223]|uniref:30S ribosomal protein S2 n=1 Tax=Gordonia aichiensis NBRC 108223 TaxID=1220583 RepID=L7KK34_9ACTN|nr:30S ribosomal protein S2 [Gordonia aichiensis NBRC 108223]